MHIPLSLKLHFETNQQFHIYILNLDLSGCLHIYHLDHEVSLTNLATFNPQSYYIQ